MRRRTVVTGGDLAGEKDEATEMEGNEEEEKGGREGDTYYTDEEKQNGGRKG